MTLKTHNHNHDEANLFDEVHIIKDELVKNHGVCDQCATEAMLSYAVSEYAIHGWDVEQLIRKVTKEFNQWELALKEAITNEGRHYRVQESILH